MVVIRKLIGLYSALLPLIELIYLLVYLFSLMHSLINSYLFELAISFIKF